jgi:hypothetical protein
LDGWRPSGVLSGSGGVVLALWGRPFSFSGSPFVGSAVDGCAGSVSSPCFGVSPDALSCGF